MSFQPQWAEAILQHEAAIELRRNRTGCVPGASVVIYTSSPVKKVTGRAQVAQVIEGTPTELWERVGHYLPLTEGDFFAYLQGARKPAAIVLTDIERLDDPKPLPFRGPQSFRYLDAGDPAQRQVLEAAGLVE